MVAYSFKKRFAEPILERTKDQTIRADRKRHARPGEALQLYTGMRTRQCRLIASANCLAVLRIALHLEQDRIALGGQGHGDLVINRAADLDAFARRDGFADWDDMTDFWRETHDPTDVFRGVCIRWQLISPSGPSRFERKD